MKRVKHFTWSREDNTISYNSYTDRGLIRIEGGFECPYIRGIILPFSL